MHASPYARLPTLSPAAFDDFGAGHFPGLLGIEMVSTDPRRLRCRAIARPELLAPHGFLHGGTLVAVADTMCGYGAIVNLPAGAAGFVTAELKCNFLGTLRQGTLVCEATPLHVGRTTQVWDAVVTEETSGRRLAVFRCTQVVLWPDA
jgi:uncharacterized protein (TIGR00369 family)